jgi:hypothetical protein
MAKFTFHSVSNKYISVVCEEHQCLLVHPALRFTSMGNIATYTGLLSIIWQPKLVGCHTLMFSLLHTIHFMEILDLRSTVKMCWSKFKIIHTPCRKTGHSMYQNHCTIITHNIVQTFDSPSTCFGLFRPSSGRYSTKKNTIMASLIFVPCIIRRNWNNQHMHWFVPLLYYIQYTGSYMFR